MRIVSMLTQLIQRTQIEAKGSNEDELREAEFEYDIQRPIES